MVLYVLVASNRRSHAGGEWKDKQQANGDDVPAAGGAAPAAAAGSSSVAEAHTT